MSLDAMKQALEALEEIADEVFSPYDNKLGDAILALRAAIEQPAQDITFNYAKHLAESIFKQHFASDEHYASGRVVWGVNDTVIGILTQIDNMVSDMVRKPAQQSSVDHAVSNVLPFNGTTILDLDPDDILEANKGQFDGVVLIGLDEDGEEILASSYSNAPTILWMLERAKLRVLKSVNEEKNG